MRRSWHLVLLSIGALAGLAALPSGAASEPTDRGSDRAAGLASKGGWVGALHGNHNYAATVSGTRITSSSIVTWALDYDGAWSDLLHGTYSPIMITGLPTAGRYRLRVAPIFESAATDTSTKQQCNVRSCIVSPPPCDSTNTLGCIALVSGASLANPDYCAGTKNAPGDSIWAFTSVTPSNAIAKITEPAFPIPLGTGTVLVEWDQVLDLPYGSGLVQYSEYRCFRSGSWSGWTNTNPSGAVHMGNDQTWVTVAEEIPEAAQADSIQLLHWIRCMRNLSFDTTSCSVPNPAIYFDNFAVYAITGVSAAPTFGLSPTLAPQTTFVDGTMTGLNCAAAPCWPGVRGSDLGATVGIHDNVNSASGDSIVVRIHCALRTKGLGVNWHLGFDKTVSGGLAIAHTNPNYVPAYGAPRMIYRLFDPATRNWSPFDSSELDADDIRVSGADTINTQSAYRMDWPPRDKAGLNLPGGFTINGVGAYNSLAFLPHGTRLQYYLKAVDAAGAVAYQFQGDNAATETQDLPTLPGGSVVAPDIMEFDVLPRVYAPGAGGTLLAGSTKTPILDLDGSYTAWSFAQDPVTQALRGLGVRADRYRLQQAPQYGNNIGGHELTGAPDNQSPRRPTNFFPNMTEYGIRDSLSAWYRILIQSGHLRNAALEDESDARLIEDWWNNSTGTNGGDRCVFASGDDYMNALMNTAGADPAPRRHSMGNNVLGVNSVNNAWNGTASVLYPTIDDRFANPSSGPGLVAGYTYPADCGCPGPNRFDALVKQGTSDAQNAVFYPTVSGVTNVAAVAIMSEKDGVVDKDRNKGLVYGFSIQFVRKAGIPTTAPNYVHSGVQERMQVLYKFLASCRGARTGSVADSGKCWPCPTDANMTGNWAGLAGFQSGTYGPLYPIQDNTAITSVEPAPAPIVNRLLQNRPNPFNPVTTIPFITAVAGQATIRVFDVGGRLVRTIELGTLPPGDHVARWDGRMSGGESAASGVYFYRVEFPGGGASSKKMILLR